MQDTHSAPMMLRLEGSHCRIENTHTLKCVCSLLLTAEWEERWVKSTHKSDCGEFKWTAGAFYGDAEKDKGINTNTLFLTVCTYWSLSSHYTRNSDQRECQVLRSERLL